MPTHFARVTRFVAPAFAACVACQAVSQTVDRRVIAISGQPLPGLPAGVVVESVGTPAISREGDIAFVAWLQGVGITSANNSGIWRQTTGGTLELVARAGDAAPGTILGEVFESFRRPIINSRGEIGFNATLSGTFVDETNDIGIWSDAGTDSLVLVAQEGSPAPGTEPGTVFKQFGSGYSLARTVPLLSDSGQLSFWSELTGAQITTENNFSNWTGSADGVMPLLRTGDPVPGYSADYLISSVGSCLFNKYGEFATAISITGPDVTEDNNRVVVVRRIGKDWEPIIRSGDPAPGFADNVVLSSIYASSINDDGMVGLHGRIEGPTFTEPSDGANWLLSPTGDIERIAHTFMQAPGLNTGITFDYLDFPNITHSGQGVFYASLNDDSSSLTQSFWQASDSGDLVMLVRKGDDPGGVEPGVTLRGIGNVLSNGRLTTHAPNGNGWMYYSAILEGPGVDDTNEFGFWARKDGVHSAMLLRTGVPIDVDDDPASSDFRTPAEIYTRDVTGGEDSYPRSLSDTNEFACRVEFTDGSWAIVVATLSCPADTNRDGVISPTDFTAWVSAFNNNDDECDQNNDGMCTPTDFSAWIENYNSGC